jgi:hypothetical protein
VKRASMVPKGNAFRVASGTSRPIFSLGKLAVPEGAGRTSFYREEGLGWVLEELLREAFLLELFEGLRAAVFGDLF